MFGLLLIYFIWKAFYELATLHGKKTWAFALLGIATYYAGTILAGVLFGVLSEFGIIQFEDSSNNLLINLASIPFGILTCWITYLLLKKRWSASGKSNVSDMLDSELLDT